MRLAKFGAKRMPQSSRITSCRWFLSNASDVFEDEVTRLAETYGDERTALQMVEEVDHTLVRF
jgi:hypothetical protein